MALFRGTFGPMMFVGFAFGLIFAVIGVISSWKIFVKAGRPGWACLIPFYNVYTQFDIVYGNGWKFLLLLIPFYNIYVMIKFYIDLAHAFGQSTAFGVGLILLSLIFMCILAFGDAQYVLGGGRKSSEPERKMSDDEAREAALAKLRAKSAARNAQSDKSPFEQ
jgi:hypothetical protein